MAVLSKTTLADALRAISLSQEEAAAILAPHGWPPTVIANMSRGATQLDPDILDVLAGYWRKIDRGEPLKPGTPQGVRLRQETVARLREIIEAQDREDFARDGMMSRMSADQIDDLRSEENGIEEHTRDIRRRKYRMERGGRP